MIRFLTLLLLLTTSLLGMVRAQEMRVNVEEPAVLGLEALLPEVKVHLAGLAAGATVHTLLMLGETELLRDELPITEATDDLVVSLGYARFPTFQCPDTPLATLSATAAFEAAGTRSTAHEMCLPLGAGNDLADLPVARVLIAPRELKHDAWLPVMTASVSSGGRTAPFTADGLLVGYIAVSMDGAAPPPPTPGSPEALSELVYHALDLD